LANLVKLVTSAIVGGLGFLIIMYGLAPGHAPLAPVILLALRPGHVISVVQTIHIILALFSVLSII
jgi:hypothetical protein